MVLIRAIKRFTVQAQGVNFIKASFVTGVYLYLANIFSLVQYLLVRCSFQVGCRLSIGHLPKLINWAKMFARDQKFYLIFPVTKKNRHWPNKKRSSLFRQVAVKKVL